MSESFRDPGIQEPSTPDLGGLNEAEAAADILSTIQSAAAEQIAHDAAKIVIATIDTKVSDQVDVVREYADLPDEIYYPAINAAVRPAVGDKVLAVERPGGMAILGVAWAPGMPDLNTVRAGTDMLTNAVDSRVLASGPNNADRAVDGNNIKTGVIAGDHIIANAIRGSELAQNAVDTGNVKDKSITGAKLASDYASDGHGHKASDNNMDTFASSGHGHGSHKHTYDTYTGATWENATWKQFNTGTSAV
jgi:hypothetical protein